jgi:hypothetical protein
MIGFEQLLLSSIGGATITILINRLIQFHEKSQNLKRQTKIFVKFIDDIIIKYLNVNIEAYEKLLSQILDEQDLFASRSFTESFKEHLEWCDFYQRKKDHFRQDLSMQQNHAKKLLEEFRDVRNELTNINELNEDEY